MSTLVPRQIYFADDPLREPPLDRQNMSLLSRFSFFFLPSLCKASGTAVCGLCSVGNLVLLSPNDAPTSLLKLCTLDRLRRRSLISASNGTELTEPERSEKSRRSRGKVW